MNVQRDFLIDEWGDELVFVVHAVECFALKSRKMSLLSALILQNETKTNFHLYSVNGS